jgi:hypothetical protein
MIDKTVRAIMYSAQMAVAIEREDGWQTNMLDPMVNEARFGNEGYGECPRALLYNIPTLTSDLTSLRLANPLNHDTCSIRHTTLTSTH